MLTSEQHKPLSFYRQLNIVDRALIGMLSQPVEIYFRKSDSTSFRAGIEGAVPGRVTDMAAVAVPKRIASSGERPSAMAAAKPPLKASPAPVVSTTGPALIAGT